jgi:hypothetical protein
VTWTGPITWTTNQTVTAAQLNSQIRDNMLLTPAALATTANSIFVGTGANAIAERFIQDQVIDTTETTTSTTFTNLATDGPSVTMTTGTKALVWTNCQIGNSGASTSAVSFEITGASSVAVSDARAILKDGGAGAQLDRYGVTSLMATTAGSNTFHMQYRVSSASTGTFIKRRIIVMGL